MHFASQAILTLLVMILTIGSSISTCQFFAAVGLTPHHHEGTTGNGLCIEKHVAPKTACCSGHGDHHDQRDRHDQPLAKDDAHQDEAPHHPSPCCPSPLPCSEECDTEQVYIPGSSQPSVDAALSPLPFWQTPCLGNNEPQHHNSMALRLPPRQNTGPPPDPLTPAITSCFLL